MPNFDDRSGFNPGTSRSKPNSASGKGKKNGNSYAFIAMLCTIATCVVAMGKVPDRDVERARNSINLLRQEEERQATRRGPPINPPPRNTGGGGGGSGGSSYAFIAMLMTLTKVSCHTAREKRSG